MLNDWSVLLVLFAYLALLFAIAFYGDKRASMGRSVISNPYIYALSMGVYCTAWTFYGSVGRAAVSGEAYLPIYLGSTLIACLWWLLLRKIVRISKAHRVTSIADFIGSRYGKSTLVGGLVTIIAVVGILPYISLQLKAVSTSFAVLHLTSQEAHSMGGGVLRDTTFYVALAMAAFAIVFGARHIDASERHEGMVAAIAFDSVVKLVAFLAVGIYVTFGLFGSPGALFQRAQAIPDVSRLMGSAGITGDEGSWMSLTFLSMSAILFLPRQFHVLVVENVNEDYIRKASWLFPLYLLVINLFVLPIAMGGLIQFHGSHVSPDSFVLSLPLAGGQHLLALWVFIGGLSAATGMVIVATVAISTMVCNDLVIPPLLRAGMLRREDLSRLLLGIRRGSILVVMLLGYLYFRLIGESYALVTIGLVSFVAAAQFVPPILIGIYWKGASRKGAVAGLLGGFLMWCYTLLLPAFARSGWLPASFVEHGLFGLAWLRPYHLFGLQVFDSVTHAVFWSMLVNIGLLVGVSLFDRQSTIEQIQANLFVDVFRHGAESRDALTWESDATVGDLRGLLSRFLGAGHAERVFDQYASSRGLQLDDRNNASGNLVSFAERQLAGAIGSASARVMVSSLADAEELSVEGVMRILDETSQVIEYSRRLEQKSQELETATRELKAANERLEELDRLKDDFVSTVSHELRTPLTSIRAFSEILRDDEHMAKEQRQEFLDILVKENERLTRLINEVLDLAKIESGRAEWEMQILDLRTVVDDALAATRQLFQKGRVVLATGLPSVPLVVLADRDRLIQVVINLVSNAVKFCDVRDGHVAVRLLERDGTARVEVADNGSGIETGEQERIFEKFHQVRDMQDGKPRGTGLGLPICKRIIEHHGGRIWVESVPGEGTTFIVALPQGRTLQTTETGSGHFNPPL